MIVSYYSIFLQKSILWLRCMYYSDESSRVKQGRGGERAGCTKYALKQTCVKALSNSLKQKTARTTFPFATARNSITGKSVSQFTFTRYCTNFLPLILVFCISLLCPFRYNNKQDTIGKGAPLQCKQPNFKPIILRPPSAWVPGRCFYPGSAPMACARQNGACFVWLFFLWPAFVFAPLCGHQFRCFMSNQPFVLLFL